MNVVLTYSRCENELRLSFKNFFEKRNQQQQTQISREREFVSHKLNLPFNMIDCVFIK
jgi:hypothetical protein